MIMFNEKVVFTNPNIPVLARVCTGKLNDFHIHSEIELISILSGSMTIKTESETYTASKGEVLFINSNIPHSTVDVDFGFSGRLVQFRTPSVTNGNLGYLFQYFNNWGSPAYKFQQSDDSKLISECINRILTEKDSNNISSEYYITSNMYMILSLLYKNNLFGDTDKLLNNKKEIERLLPVLEYIDSHYHESISIDDLSSILNLNSYYFCRVFKKIMGSTAINYINFVRTYYAKKLLFTGKTILDISLETGFSSLSYFNRTFKKYFQYPPSVYKKIAGRADNLI